MLLSYLILLLQKLLYQILLWIKVGIKTVENAMERKTKSINAQNCCFVISPVRWISGVAFDFCAEVCRFKSHVRQVALWRFFKWFLCC